MGALLLFCAVLAFLELDTTYLGQVLLSRPLVVGSALGFLTGNFFIGLQLGIFTELIYLDFIPIGGVVPPSGAISAGIAVLMAHIFAMDIYFAFFIGILCGIIFSFVERKIRRYRAKLLPKIERALYEGKTSIGKVMLQSIIFQFLAVFAFALVALTIFGPLFSLINQDIPEKLHIAFKFSYFVVPWVGLSILFISFSTKPKTD
ncbi:MAG: PTS sugar transporter subunit IIC [Elusimicrobiota bacterium]|jgi:mannose/fructose/N-acetylgalactosamine-specific phosphotransferase system component IIC|nr:PTS sugar transporter subunit IIC [Elusimicrobiota bacterium]